jgi:hypothetical protein
VLLMNTYRIVPLRGTYKVEAVEPNGRGRVIGAWPSEKDAVAQLKELEAKEQAKIRRLESYR